MALRLNLTFDLGATWKVPFTAYDDAGEPLTTVAAAEIRIGFGTVTYIRKVLGDGVAPGQGPGEFVATIEPSDQVDLVARVHRYELWSDDNAGETLLQVFGTMNVRDTLRGEPPADDIAAILDFSTPAPSAYLGAL